ncbi:DNA mismatch repair endonuclease MutL [Chloroflexota bacterium]
MVIQVLKEDVISQIAAGEVVARPASVVKELVENALDAGATQVSVEVGGGGVSLLRVTDNGSGIPSAEVALAFTRHATSKIASLDDLPVVRSLGFRGEALPSIAAVARVEMLACAAGEEAGTSLAFEDGNVVSRGRQARSIGTTVTVRELFGKVPARRKFLKTPATENGHIANVVSQYALAFPEVRFSLSVDGRSVLLTSGKGELIESIIEVYGLEVAQGMLPLGAREREWIAGGIPLEISGFVSAPTLHRSGRGYLSFFINRRWVNNRVLTYAVEEAYHGLLMTGRHPLAVLNIQLTPSEVDVNVHPAKSEVKFRDERIVFSAVQRSVRQAFVAQMPVLQIEEVAAAFTPVKAGMAELWTQRDWRATTPEIIKAAPETVASLPVLRVLGQAMNRYLVAEGPDGLYLIDQHAAHERIRYERIKQQHAQRKVELQGLLEPVTMEVAPRQVETMKLYYRDLAEFGFQIEPFGERAYLVRAVPALLQDGDWLGMLRELLDSLGEDSGGRWEEKTAVSLACHGAVRAGQALSDNEMRALVRDLEQVPNPRTCPHGRPTVIHLTSARLEREFGRA